MDGSERQASFSFRCTSSWFESFEPLEKRTNRQNSYAVRTVTNNTKYCHVFFPYILFQIKLICDQKIKQLGEFFYFLEDSAPLETSVVNSEAFILY
jgi:hypothetical protein